MLPPSSFQISFTMISPFSNQGLDCEYRHSEVARLNPRDCWYWLAGNCINPTCGFRHPVSSFSILKSSYRLLE
ncbi:hypothetical protein ES319_A01G036800v1 [Gossypium barbadense]|uniref:C3H1-type domain-containing protein n=1 Tax=Gossypium barbadense TaxID=3634 RepID=A0A5J5WT08_GOSBA|nr:hypothetical protein ES319_A01G036800v1 [Gossypium barbadense]